MRRERFVTLLMVAVLTLVFCFPALAELLPINETEGDGIHITQIIHSTYNPTGPYSSTNCGPASFAMCLRALNYLGYGSAMGEWTAEEQVDHARALMYPNGQEGVYPTSITRNRIPYKILSCDSKYSDAYYMTTAIQTMGGSSMSVSSQADLDKALGNGMPVVLFGYLDTEWRNQFSPLGHWSGTCPHYIAVTGKTNTGYYIVNDPMYQYGADLMTYDQLSRFPSSGQYASGYAFYWKTPTPFAIRKSNGLVYVFARNLSNKYIYFSHQTAQNGGFTEWQAVNTTAVSGNPVVIEQPNGRFLLFVRGASKQIMMFTEDSNGTMTITTDFGGETYYDLAVNKNQDGRVEFFARGIDGIIYKRNQITINGGFSDWVSMGGLSRSAPTVVRNADGRQELFVGYSSGVDNTQPAHIWQTAANGGWTSSWIQMGGHMKGRPMALRNGEDSGYGDNCLYTFVRSAVDNYTYYKTGRDGWANYGLAGSQGYVTFGQPSLGMMTYYDSTYAAYYSDLCIFVRGVDNRSHWSRLQRRGSSYTWTSWQNDDPDGIITTDPVVGRFANGRTFVVVRGLDGSIFYRIQAGDTGGWSSWTQIGTYKF